MAEERGRGSLMDNNVPSQLDEEDLKAELEIEIPDSQTPIVTVGNLDGEPAIEIIMEDDGGVVVDFEPLMSRPDDGGF